MKLLRINPCRPRGDSSSSRPRAAAATPHVPSGSVAVVDGTEISKREFDQFIANAKNGYKADKREFPKAVQREYQSLKTQYVAILVQREQFDQEGEDLGIEITDKDLDKAEDELVSTLRRQVCRVREGAEGARPDTEAAAAQAGLGPRFCRRSCSTRSRRTSRSRIRRDPRVVHAESGAAYGTPESRDVRHILIAEKGANGQVDFEKSKAEAERDLRRARWRRRLRRAGEGELGGSRLQGLGRQAQDRAVKPCPSSTRRRSSWIRAISKPVKTQYGYHVIQAVSPVRNATRRHRSTRWRRRSARLCSSRRNQRPWPSGSTSSGSATASQLRAGLRAPDVTEETNTETPGE